MCTCAEKRDWDAFDAILHTYQTADAAQQRAELIPILQKLQDEYGYLPQDVLARLAEKMGVFVSDIMGVVTFYSQFRLQPVGKNVVKICFGTACHVLGAQQIADSICRELDIKLGETTADNVFTVESVACLGCCSLAPVLTLNDETHGRLTPETAQAIVRDFKSDRG